MRRTLVDVPYDSSPSTAPTTHDVPPHPVLSRPVSLTVTVVICADGTSGWIDLNAAIASAARQPETSEVIVVVDHDEALLQRTSDRWGSLTTVVHNRQPRGRAGARNTALALASGDVVAYLDDDAAAEPGWLNGMLTHYADERVLAVGGSARPVWPSPVAPLRLPPELLCAVGCTWVYSPVEQAALSSVVDCAVSFRRSALETVGGFAQTELTVWSRLRATNPLGLVVFEPNSRVTHRVAGDGMRWSRLISSFFAVGVSRSALLDRDAYGRALRIERRFVTVVLPRAFAREVLAGHPTAAMSIPIAVACGTAGFIYGALRRPRVDGPGQSLDATVAVPSTSATG